MQSWRIIALRGRRYRHASKTSYCYHYHKCLRPTYMGFCFYNSNFKQPIRFLVSSYTSYRYLFSNRYLVISLIVTKLLATLDVVACHIIKPCMGTNKHNSRKSPMHAMYFLMIQQFMKTNVKKRRNSLTN
jgi:hypothetical protein